MKIVNVNTGEHATSVRWNMHGMSEIIVMYPGDGGMDSDYSKNWACACHNLPLTEDSDGRGTVMCQKDKEITR